MFAYSSNLDALHGYVAANAAAARGIKASSPGMPVTLMANGQLGKTIAPFDSIVTIPDSLLLPGRQWWSRTMSLNATPYDMSLMIDSDRVVCGDLMPLFRILLEWDMVGASAGFAGGFPGNYDNGVLGYKRGDAFNSLLATWLRIQRAMDQGGDDQHTLSRAFREHPEFRPAIVSPAWHVKYAPLRRNLKADLFHTLVVHGAVVVYANVSATEGERQGLCEWLNADLRPRVLVRPRGASLERVEFAFSQVECDAFTGGVCNHPEISWPPPPVAISFLEYVKQH